MESGSNIRKYITFGVVVLISGCVGAVIMFGGLSWMGFDTKERVTTTPEITPSSPETDLSDVESPIPSPQFVTIPYKAVVQIIAMYDDNGVYKIGWTGSGSIISPDGFILTNAHVVLPDRYFPIDALKIALTLEDDQPPVISYYAEVLQADESLDIAVIRITTDLDGNPVDFASLNLPYVLLGDADDLRLGDPIRILGYPGIGGDTITLTPGAVGGFTSEGGRGDRAFIKTSATIAGGNSGGLAANLEGFLIGIPTQLGYGGDDQFVDCRVLADTNRDGKIDDRDSCIPTGGFINALRPVNLAYQLIEAARNGEMLKAEESSPLTSINIPGQGSILFEDDFSDSGSGWGSWEGEKGVRGYVNGEYQIEVLADNYIIWSHTGESFTDVIIEVDAYVVNGAEDGDFGILCRYQDASNFYSMEISEDGQFAIWKLVDGEYFSLVDWRGSSLFSEVKGRVHFTVACVGETLTLAINGELMAQVHDSDLTSGDVGVIVGTLESAGIVVGFDNFRVSSPDQ